MKRLAEHQTRIIQMMNERPVLGIFAEAGTGKTMIALAWIYDSMMSGVIDSALVICPAALIPSWVHSIRRMTEFGYSDFDVELMLDFVHITSYQKVWMSDGTYRGYKRYKLRPEIDRQWDAVFVDESHRLGDPKSVQTKQSLNLAKKCARRYIMTGTPDSGNYVKLYGQIKFLDPQIWESYRDFDRRYVLAHNHFRKPIRFDVNALERLKMSYGTVVRLRDCYDMPSENEVEIPVDCAETGIYGDFIHNRVSGYGFDVTVAGIGSQKALQICSGFYLDAQGESHRVRTNKTAALQEIIDGSDEKIVVFCRYITSMDMICDMLDRGKVSYYRFDGSTKNPVWKDFQTDGTKVFVAQYQRGCEGIDLFAACRMVFYEPTQSAFQLEQSKARIMRKGQTRPCVYYHMFCQNTIEAETCANVRRGVDVSREMLDKWAEIERLHRQNAKKD